MLDDSILQSWQNLLIAKISIFYGTKETMNYSYKLCSDGSRAESTKELNFPLSIKDIRGVGFREGEKRRRRREERKGEEKEIKSMRKTEKKEYRRRRSRRSRGRRKTEQKER